MSDNWEEESVGSIRVNLSMGEVDKFSEDRLKSVTSFIEAAEQVHANDPAHWENLKKAGALLAGLLDVGVQAGLMTYAPDDTKLDESALDAVKKELEES
jgi:hypothetical protein